MVLLHEAQAQLCKVIQQKFDESVKDADAASVERFFKIFPLLNMHEEGISKFGVYLASQVTKLYNGLYNQIPKITLSFFLCS